MTSIKAVVLTGMLLGAAGMVPTLASAQVTIQSEEAAHPRLVTAIQEMKAALHELESAPDDFGGRKAQAIADTRGDPLAAKSPLLPAEDPRRAPQTPPPVGGSNSPT